MKLLIILLLVSILKVAFPQGSQKDPWEIESASSKVLSASSVPKSAASEILTNKLHHKSSQVEHVDRLFVKSIKSRKGRQVEKVDGADDRETVTVGVDRSPKIEQLRYLKRLPLADGYLHIYALPVGDGDAQVLQCPNGDIAIVDFGSLADEKAEFWATKEIKAFLHGHNDKIKNIVISHDSYHHYKFLRTVFPDSRDLSGLRNIYISCSLGAVSPNFRELIERFNASNQLRTFNGGHTCGSSNGKPCESIALCPENPEVVTRVLSANAANCSGPRTSIDSIVLLIKYKTFTILLSGDFEDYTNDLTENGLQKQMVDFYGPDLLVTVYKLSSHGSDCFANKPIMLDAVRPKAVYFSANPFHERSFVRCSITDYLIAKNYLCKPAETNSTSQFYCGKHPVTYVTICDNLQQEFGCGLSRPSDPRCFSGLLFTKRRNQYAIYTTMPTINELNLVHLLTDGTKWGFVNNIQQKIIR